MKRTYSQEEKAEALAKCAELGSAYLASKELPMSARTLAYWAKEAGVCTCNQEKTKAATEAREIRIAAKRAALKERLLDEAVYCAEAIHNEHIDFKSAGPLGPVKVVFPVAPAAAVQNYATSLAIFLDKFRLESGEVTSRDEHRNIVESELDREIAALVAEHDRRAQAGVTRSPDSAPVRVDTDSPTEATTS